MFCFVVALVGKGHDFYGPEFSASPKDILFSRGTNFALSVISNFSRQWQMNFIGKLFPFAVFVILDLYWRFCFTF